MSGYKSFDNYIPSYEEDDQMDEEQRRYNSLFTTCATFSPIKPNRKDAQSQHETAEEFSVDASFDSEGLNISSITGASAFTVTNMSGKDRSTGEEAFVSYNDMSVSSSSLTFVHKLKIEIISQFIHVKDVSFEFDLKLSNDINVSSKEEASGDGDLSHSMTETTIEPIPFAEVKKSQVDYRFLESPRSSKRYDTNIVHPPPAIVSTLKSNQAHLFTPIQKNYQEKGRFVTPSPFSQSSYFTHSQYQYHHFLNSSPRILHQTKQQPNKVTSCNCSKSKCLKLYCSCFSGSLMCSSKCSCSDCHNNEDTPQHSHERQRAIAAIQAMNPNAFSEKVKNGKHTTGCSCSKEICLRKYCDCFKFGVTCGPLCNCSKEKCKNFQGSEELREKAAKMTKKKRKYLKKYSTQDSNASPSFPSYSPYPYYYSPYSGHHKNA